MISLYLLDFLNMGVVCLVHTLQARYLQIAASPVEDHEDDWGIELMT